MSTTLSISVIGGAQSSGYSDKLVTPRKPIFQGVYETEIVTSNQVRFKDDAKYLVRNVQKSVYRKYKIQFIVNSLYYLELAKLSTRVVIHQENEADHLASIIEITRTLIGADTYLVDLTYFDLYSETIAEFLKSSFVYGSGNQMYSFNYAPNKYIYTMIKPISIYDEPTQETYINNDTNVLVKSVLKKKKRYTFFLNQSDLIDVQNNIYTYLCSEGAYIGKEVSKMTVSELNGFDIFKVQIDLVFEINKYFSS